MNKVEEKQGVAIYPYENEMDKIVDYIVDTCRRIDNQVEFILPKYFTDIIDFIETLIIKVIYNKNERHGGQYHYDENEKELTKDGKLKYAVISIYYNKSDNRQMICSTLYHEFNHIYDSYINLLKNNNLNRFNKSAFKAKLSKEKIFSNPIVNDVFTKIIYRLFSETEFNALVASVYGDLKYCSNIRILYKQDKKKTTYYKVYDYIKKNHRILRLYINDNNYKQLDNLLQSYNIHIRYRNDNYNSFVNSLEKKILYYLDKLEKKADRVAKLYYDTIEMKSVNEQCLVEDFKYDKDYLFSFFKDKEHKIDEKIREEIDITLIESYLEDNNIDVVKVINEKLYYSQENIEKNISYIQDMIPKLFLKNTI